MEEKFLNFVAGLFEVDPSSLTLDTAYGEIPEWDSLMQLRLVAEIGDEYGVEIPIDEVGDITTLGGFFEYVKG